LKKKGAWNGSLMGIYYLLAVFLLSLMTQAIASFLGEMPPNPTTAACQWRTPDASSFLL